jgi:hypothetical protein
MWVLRFNTREEAEARSFAEAAARLGDNHTTELWWGWVERDGEYWLLCDAGTEGAENMVPIDAAIVAGNAAMSANG